MSTTIHPENQDLRVCVDQGGIAIGPLLEPRNNARHAGAGSIHDDATAQKLGFRGGTVAGSLHMEQFPPLLCHVFGPRWWQNGGMSLYFRYATSDREAVRCFAKQDKPLQSVTKASTNIWMEDVEDHLVAEGTASIGGVDELSALRMRISDVPKPNDLRILKAMQIGDVSKAVAVKIEREALKRRLEVITEPSSVYESDSPYCTPALMVQAMRASESEIMVRHKDMGVGLFGAIELQHINGPVYVGRDYTCTTTVLAVSETPKTEYVWYESMLHDEANQEIASMLMMLRFMKASSALWQ